MQNVNSVFTACIKLYIFLGLELIPPWGEVSPWLNLQYFTAVLCLSA